MCPVDGYPMVADERVGATPAELGGLVLDGKYRLVGRLGQGAMGEVWRAEHVLMASTVAVKVIRARPELGLEGVRRFCHEARATSRLAHPNTIRVTDFGVTPDGLLYMVMELLRGRDLRAEITPGSALPLDRTLRIARQVAKSLAEAHAAGVVHRDLKPSNIFLAEVFGEGDFVKVIDFGVAKALGDGSTTDLTVPGATVGTPRYMAPEQVTGGAVGPAADLYALGGVLFEMLTGAAPYPLNDLHQLLYAHVHGPVPELPVELPSGPAPAELRRLVAELLAKDPGSRPASAAVVGERLDALLRPAGGRAWPAPVPEGDSARLAGDGRGTTASEASREAVATGLTGTRSRWQRDDWASEGARSAGSSWAAAVRGPARWRWALGIAAAAIGFVALVVLGLPSGGPSPSEAGAAAGGDESTLAGRPEPGTEAPAVSPPAAAGGPDAASGGGTPAAAILAGPGPAGRDAGGDAGRPDVPPAGNRAEGECDARERGEGASADADADPAAAAERAALPSAEDRRRGKARTRPAAPPKRRPTQQETAAEPGPAPLPAPVPAEPDSTDLIQRY